LLLLPPVHYNIIEFNYNLTDGCMHECHSR
jgi:hypothetical protein